MTYRKSWIWSFQRTHYWTPKIQGGGNLPSWKSWNRHISTRNYPILMKFGIQIQSWISVTVTWTNVRIFKTQDGGRRHIENRKVTISQRKASTNTNKSNAYANKYQREIVSDAILSLRNADHRILVWTCASTEDLTNLSTQIHISAMFSAYKQCYAQMDGRTHSDHTAAAAAAAACRMRRWVSMTKSLPGGSFTDDAVTHHKRARNNFSSSSQCTPSVDDQFVYWL